jgi:putative membrane protein
VESAYLLLPVFLSSMAGAGAGFCTGLVPGLHVNNLAAIVVASSSSVAAFFGIIGGLAGGYVPGMMVACFLVSALVSHMFSEAVISTYLGIPSGDTVSLLPAHRLAKNGLGRHAVRVSAQGSLFGVAIGILLLVPISVDTPT